MLYKIKKFIIKWFGDILIYKYPIFIIFGHTAYKMKGEDVRDVLNVIKPGDIVLRRYNNYLSGLLIPGYFTHASIYVGDDKIVHMLANGVTQEDILTFCRCDNIAIIHCNSEQISNIAIDKANEVLAKGAQYDYNFDFADEERFSCTEIINHIYEDPKFERKNPSYIMPDDFLSLDPEVFTISYRKG